MDGAATWGQESFSCTEISCFAYELLYLGTSGTQWDSAGAETCSRATLELETDLGKAVFRYSCGPSGIGDGTDERSCL